MSTFLSEAFKKLDLLEEEDFNISKKDGTEEMSMFIDNDEDNPSIHIIDADAEDRDELEDSYEGQVIFECPICHSKIFKKIESVKIEDGEELANIDEECPYCYSIGGYKIIGMVAPYKEAEEEDIEIETNDEEITQNYVMVGPRYFDLKIYKTDKKEPIFVNEEGIEEMGKWKLDAQTDYPPKQRNFTVTMRVGGTFIDIKAIHLKSGISIKTKFDFN